MLSHADGGDRVLASLDSNHRHEHVLAELNAYAVLVSFGSYYIVFDTAIEDLSAGSFFDRPWDVGNNPKMAVNKWLKTHHEFEIDKDIDGKLLINEAPDSYLKRLVYVMGVAFSAAEYSFTSTLSWLYRRGDPK